MVIGDYTINIESAGDEYKRYVYKSSEKIIRHYAIVNLKTTKLKRGFKMFKNLDLTIKLYYDLDEPELHKIVYIDEFAFGHMNTIVLTKETKCQTLKEW